MKIELYTKPTCQSCVIAKRYLLEHNIPYTEHVIGVDLSRDDAIAKFPEAKMVPIAVVDDEYIGSKEQLLQLLSEQSAA